MLELWGKCNHMFAEVTPIKILKLIDSMKNRHILFSNLNSVSAVNLRAGEPCFLYSLPYHLHSLL